MPETLKHSPEKFRVPVLPIETFNVFESETTPSAGDVVSSESNDAFKSGDFPRSQKKRIIKPPVHLDDYVRLTDNNDENLTYREAMKSSLKY